MSGSTDEDNDTWDLLPLTPEYIEAEHGGYVRALEKALDAPKYRNIALSGNYGVGKSSILEELTRRQRERVVVLSLSTLTPIAASDLDDSVPKQATTPTNRIQQEIVKQLLYREDSRNHPGSRFRRIEHFDLGRGLGLSALLGLVIAVVFLLAGWTDRIATALNPVVDLGVWIHPSIFALASGVALATGYLLHGRMHIKQLGAASATVTLEEQSVSYFDQYLDEIVYFFEKSDRDIVIFEDIDRFNDSHIFETLRALNTLLNAAPRIKKPVRFVYAIKDSIFDKLGLEQERRLLDPAILETKDPAQAEAMRANRTKFFDLVIPVVPFITHRSARNLATQLLDKIKHKIEPELIDLATRYVPDMRLLKNARNEFIIFRDRIFSGDGEKLDLRESDLFAMMLYKSTHLTDFEKVRIGTSSLDTLYDMGRLIVRENVKRLESEVRAARRRLKVLDSLSTRGPRLGDRLIAHTERTLRAIWPGRQIPGQYLVGGALKSEDDLRSNAFWLELAEAGKEANIQWRRTNGTTVLTFSRADIEAVLGIKLDAEAWRGADRQEAEESLDDKLGDLKLLREADMAALVARPDLTAAREGSKGEESLGDVAKELLQPGLAYELVKAGYLNGNFSLYTATFHGDRVTAPATNFIMHHVERGLMDENFELEADDVEAVIRERGEKALADPALYNIAILNHLLRSEGASDRADIMIESLLSLGEDQMRFLQAFLAGGAEQDAFIARFTHRSPRVFDLLVNRVELDDAARLHLVDVALASLDVDHTYRINRSVSKYLADNYASFDVLRSESASKEQAERIASLFSDASVGLSSLAPLSAGALQAFVAQDLYDVTGENLRCALGQDSSLALDAICENEQVYAHVLSNLGDYLAIDEVPHTIENSDGFLVVVEDVLENDADALDDVIRRSAVSCVVSDLSTVSVDAWPVLAAHAKFPATFSNVAAYLDEKEGVDANIAATLVAEQTVTEHTDAEEDAKVALATSILTAKQHLSPELRAQIAGDLKLKKYVAESSIPAESGELFALLIRHDVVTAHGAYAHLSGTDWKSRERVVEESGKRSKDRFLDAISVELVQGDLANILTSVKVGRRVKDAVTERAGELFAAADGRALRELAKYATSHDRVIPTPIVERMASANVGQEEIVALLAPHLDSLEPSRLFAILAAMGGDYAKLTNVGRDTPKIPNTVADQALLKCLEGHGIVSKAVEQGSKFKVYKKHK